MKRITLALLLGWLLAMTAAPARADSDSIALQVKRVGKFTARVITVNLRDPDVRVSVAVSRGGIGTREGFGSMLSRLQPDAAITGAHFALRSSIPVSDLMVHGQRVHIGFVGTPLAITADNEARFISRADLRHEWDQYVTAIGGGPRLLRHGVYALDARGEGYRDPGLFGAKLRVAVGVTRQGKLLLVTVKQPLHFGELASVMKTLGAVDAIAMDGGTSSAQYYRGRPLVHPGRSLTNLLVVYDAPRKFEVIAARLAPGVAPLPVRVAGAPALRELSPWVVSLVAAPARPTLHSLRGEPERTWRGTPWELPPALHREGRSELEEALEQQEPEEA